MTIVRHIFAPLGDLVFTPGPEQVWARAQHEGWRVDGPDGYCHRCGASAGPGAVTEMGCSFCRDQKFPWERTVRLASYRNPMREWLTDMKFRRHWAWCRLLGGELGDRVNVAPGADSVIVCPVPMHWARRWGRGYNQAQLIAESLAARRGWACASLLKRVRRTPPQTTVPKSQRATNVRGSFAIPRVDLKGWEVWLVDDVKTTGATLTACAGLLRDAGAARVNVAVAAVADPPEVRAAGQVAHAG